MPKKKELFILSDKILSKFESSIGFEFINHKLLKEALTHRSYANEIKKNIRDNERLEFLGDSILNFIITDHLHKNFPNTNEGTLAKMRCSLVSSDALASVADRIKLGEYLQLGYGEEETGGRIKKSILENSLEALVGAMYIDSGITKTKVFVIRVFSEMLKKIEDDTYYKDSKTILQEIIQKSYKITPQYKILKEEVKNNKHLFTVGIFVSESKYAEGKGSSKKEAEMDAASNAMEVINNTMI